jgi:hypothetical protein
VSFKGREVRLTALAKASMRLRGFFLGSIEITERMYIVDA